MTSPLRWLHVPLPAAAAVALSVAGAPVAMAQGTGTIRGTVTDAVTNRPVDGAQILVVGTSLTTISNATGQFQLGVPEGQLTLRVRRVGYASATKAVTVTAGADSVADFALNQAAIGLDAVVVTGTGTETEVKKLGNTVVQIDAEQLAARDPSVSILPSGGLAGEGAQIRIRSPASITQANEPVVYVDGVRVDRSGGFGDLIGAGGGGTPSRLDDINPEAIDHIEILKGAAAATLYGTEASAGVIQIFTKRGARGSPRFDFLTEQSFGTYPVNRYAPNAGFARWNTVAECVTAGNTTFDCQNVLPVAARLNQFYGVNNIQAFQVFERPFIRELFETGAVTTVSGAVSGGTPGVQYYVNGRGYRENGPFGGEQLGPARDIDRKAQGTATLVILPTEHLKLQVMSGYVDAHHETPNNNNNIYAPATSAIFGHPERATCVTPRASSTPTGNGGCTGAGNPFGVGSFGTVREDMQRTNKQDTKHFTGSLNAQYQATPTLSLDGTLGVDVVSQVSQAFRPFGNDLDGFINVSPQGNKTVDDRTQRIITADAKITWHRQLGERFSTVFVAGGQGIITKLEDEGSTGEAFPGPGLEVTGAAANQTAYERFLQTVNAGTFAQGQLGYREFAFLTLGGRYDRNSAFGKTSQGVFYPKASVSLIPSAMPGWGRSALTYRFPTLRFRAAIGQSGLQPGAFDKFTTFVALPSDLGPGLAPGNLGNPELRPEIGTEWELGTEVGALQNQVGLNVTYWRRVTRNALYPRQYATSGGFRFLQLSNIGEIRSGGYDIEANVLPVNRPNLSIKVFASAAWMWDFVTKLGTAPPLKVGGSYPRYRNFVREGYPAGALFGAKLPGPCSARPAGATYRCLSPGQLPYDLTGPSGVPDGNPDTESELLAYLAVPRNPSVLNPLLVDEDGDGDFLDHYLGKSTPDWQGAFGLSATVLRNFELSSRFEFKFGNYTITNLTDAFRQANPVIGRNIRKAAEVEATLLNPASTPAERLAAARTWAYELKALSPYDGLNQNQNGAFLRFRELSLTYNVPTRWAERHFGLRYLSLTFSARNLALWTPYRGIDPELNEYGRGGASADLGGIDQNFGGGIDAFGFALPRRFTLAVRTGF